MRSLAADAVLFGAVGGPKWDGNDTQVYDTYEIERIAGVAFELARTRKNRVCSMEKRNVMKSGVLWNQVVTETHKAKYADVQLEHMLADAGGMQLVRQPKQFDVIVTDNLFGDMLSDVAAMLTGSLGMLPSASLGAPDPKTGKRKALYEPVHGSAPDIAGKGIANPIAMIASFAMCLRYSFNLVKEADNLEKAIANVLDKGIRTGDIMAEGCSQVGTTEMGNAILAEFNALSARAGTSTPDLLLSASADEVRRKHVRSLSGHRQTVENPKSWSRRRLRRHRRLAWAAQARRGLGERLLDNEAERGARAWTSPAEIAPAPDATRAEAPSPRVRTAAIEGARRNHSRSR
ncbi:hypothetical protein GGE07_005949 [Sinorhizobium terangae]|nr:hypothetical protein [Sinorhizobium terangae]